MSIEVVQIEDSETGSVAQIAPTLGFNCFSFMTSADGQRVEALWHDPEFLGGETRSSRSGIPILFPFAGRIRQGRFTFLGREYQLEKNDPQGVNAIHGFVYTRPWRVVECTDSSVTGEFQASLDDPSILSQWPGDFRIRAKYQVRRSQLLCRYELANPGDTPLPWWFGTHPYFRLSLAGGRPEDAVVRIQVAKEWDLEQLLPTGKVTDVASAMELAAGFTVSERQFDNVFTNLGIGDQPWSASVTDAQAGITTTISLGQPFRECVVFIPPHREAICIEPYSGLPNAFELAERGIDTGLAILAPGSSIVLEMRIESQQKSRT